MRVRNGSPSIATDTMSEAPQDKVGLNSCASKADTFVYRI